MSRRSLLALSCRDLGNAPVPCAVLWTPGLLTGLGKDIPHPRRGPSPRISPPWARQPAAGAGPINATHLTPHHPSPS